MHDRIGAGPAGVGVVVRGVGRVFDASIRAIEHIDLTAPAGQFLSILGPSGCGKSTLLRLIAGLDHPSEGQIELTPPAALPGLTSYAGRPEIAYVFQDAHLLPWRTVLDNVALPLELRGVGAADRRPAAAAALEQVGLSECVKRYPAQLSGGMRMRASLARALVTDPQLLLLDEPFAALDEITRQRLDEQLRELWLRRGMTVIFVTHSIAEAVFLSQRAIMLSPRPARIVADSIIHLPQERTASLRADVRFAAEMRVLFEALQAGS